MQQRFPFVGLQMRQVQHQMPVHIHKTDCIFNPFDIPAHPIHSLRHPTEEKIAFHSVPSRSRSTQVSLLPPPWEEFTTSDPFFIATRVNPPGMTLISLP